VLQVMTQSPAVHATFPLAGALSHFLQVAPHALMSASEAQVLVAVHL
jgi:hypothetical protein